MDFLIHDARPRGEIHPVMKMPDGVWVGSSSRCLKPSDLDYDAHGYGKRFIERGNEILTAFLEMKRA
jgi:hypothetical protein